MIAEAFVPSFGSLGIGGLIAFVLGSVVLIDTDLPEFGIPYGLIAGVSVASAALLIVAFGMVMRGRRRPLVSGREAMVGAIGEAGEDFDGEGWIRIHGELWRARSERRVRRGERVRVRAIDGLVLMVEPAGEG
jgi:membrane-bound serine protease (ClpP class)